jgi:hypothetical protein
MRATVRDASEVIELRQYTLHPGQRDVLVDLFDRFFLDPQEELGMRILGQFRDLDDPDRFVWLRGFPDLPSRAGLLGAFYGGPVWRAHRDAANATMVDSDDVLLLRPADPDSGLPLSARAAARAGASDSLVVAAVYLLRAPADDGFVTLFRERVSPILESSGARLLGSYRTEYGKNDFPRLPVREGEHAFVWLASFGSAADYERHRAALARDEGWTRRVEPALAEHFRSSPQVLRLAPTSRSRLAHDVTAAQCPNGAATFTDRR